MPTNKDKNLLRLLKLSKEPQTKETDYSVANKFLERLAIALNESDTALN